jgi:hypothetical protein
MARNCCYGLMGLPELINTGWQYLGAGVHPAPDPQHLPYESRRYWDGLAKDLTPVYAAPSAEAAERGWLRWWGRRR